MAKKPLEVKLLFDKVKVCVVYEPHEIRCNADVCDCESVRVFTTRFFGGRGRMEEVESRSLCSL